MPELGHNAPRKSASISTNDGSVLSPPPSCLLPYMNKEETKLLVHCRDIRALACQRLSYSGSARWDLGFILSTNMVVSDDSSNFMAGKTFGTSPLWGVLDTGPLGSMANVLCL
jgi:hypothetical protein